MGMKITLPFWKCLWIGCKNLFHTLKGEDKKILNIFKQCTETCDKDFFQNVYNIQYSHFEKEQYSPTEHLYKVFFTCDQGVKYTVQCKCHVFIVIPDKLEQNDYTDITIQQVDWFKYKVLEKGLGQYTLKHL